MATSQNLYLFEEIADEGGLASAVLSHQHHHRPGVKNDSRSQRLKRNIILLAVEGGRGPFSPLRELRPGIKVRVVQGWGVEVVELIFFFKGQQLLPGIMTI